MTSTTKRILCATAGLAWVVIAGYGIRATQVDDGDDWEGPYMVFNLALMAGAVLMVIAVQWSSRSSARPGLRTAGLVVCAVGAVATVVAWALPLWMLVLGLGLATVAAATESARRRSLVLFAAGQFAGLASLAAGIAAEVGERDSYGDYPAAGGIALIVTAVVTILAIVDVSRQTEPQATRDRPQLDARNLRDVRTEALRAARR